MEPEPECQLCLSPAVDQHLRLGCFSSVPVGKVVAKVSDVLSKHFWFELQPEKNGDCFVCLPCWTKVQTFHEYYEQVWDVHAALKVESVKQQQQHVKAENAYEYLKYVPSDNEDPNQDNYEEYPSVKSESEAATSEEEPEEAPEPVKRKRGRPRKVNKEITTRRNFSPGKSSNALIAKYFSLKCTQCDAALCDLTDAKCHYKAKHQTAGYLVCCAKRFDKRKAIRDHCQFHEDSSDHKCFECEKIYSSARRLETHRLGHHPAEGDTRLGCDQCDRSFVTAIQLSMHQRKHVQRSEDGTSMRVAEDDDLVRQYISLVCDLCGLPFDSFSDARLHHRTVHDQNGYVICCGKKFFKKFRVLQHCEWHADPRKFDCTVCGRNFLDSVSLSDHTYRMHAPEHDRMFQCEMCDRNFQQKCQLRYHQQKVHMRDEDKKYECYQCGKRFIFLSFLQNHMNSAHDPVPSFVCDVCAKYFKSQASYELHYALEHSNVCQKVQCQLCGKWLKHAKTLARHMFFHRAQPETCQQCGHVAPSKRALYSHTRLVHRDPTHKCLVCGKMFKKTHTLKEHMAIHAGITDLYTCWYCPKTFRSSSNMYKHRKLVHSLEFEAHKLAAAAAMTIGGEAPVLETPSDELADASATINTIM